MTILSPTVVGLSLGKICQWTKCDMLEISRNVNKGWVKIIEVTLSHVKDNKIQR